MVENFGVNTHVQGHYIHARLKKETSQLRNIKIHSSRRIAFLQKKGITLIYAM